MMAQTAKISVSVIIIAFIINIISFRIINFS